MSGHSATAFIFARGGSKGVPRKNLRVLAGKPLIAHAIHTAHAAARVSRVVVSTDDDEIARVAEEWGAVVPFRRPAELAGDDAPEWLAWQHALREEARLADGRLPNVFLSVPATSPIRSGADLDRCIDALVEGDYDIVLSVTPSRRNPYFNMVVLEEGLARLAVPPTTRAITRRQDVPPMFDITTVAYAARPSYVLQAEGLFGGRVGAVVLDEDRSVDIDTEFDLQVAECLLSSDRLGPRRPRE